MAARTGDDPDAQAIASSPEVESQLSSLLYDMSQQVQTTMGNMLKMIVEIDQNSAGIMEEIEKCKESTLERKKVLEEEKERFQKAAFTALDMLNNRC
ncbi:hypothetical protein JCGZ_07806 [Jatropha curcas]|uniref:Polyamine-modulated factor 1-binding protein 1 n=1 Tax=Jatropha curcas TaxID=180498 RepID=A0A067KPP5_JATCU|nr:uncharacterized protein LOC105638395 [Jatropha curcas]XP_020536328.1 uncharacterized protein LOC105638395 [Jatropha curcas]XP_020536329.1 uncharacterized protein LOC105638395 [Jatropha curcas]XP_037497040.1 uncharacterized protein LOC105638395 [Jatropha curcas]XP_037497041.1 uncharacterized protein LOC105638395 [Jatropha curcas]KDP34235.1 hypothetical protein JCGZ_07806 [Jatropha curcas]